MLTRMNIMGADLAAMEDLKQIYVAIASVPAKNLSGLETALAGLPIFINRCFINQRSDLCVFSNLNQTSSRHRENHENISRRNFSYPKRFTSRHN